MSHSLASVGPLPFSATFSIQFNSTQKLWGKWHKRSYRVAIKVAVKIMKWNEKVERSKINKSEAKLDEVTGKISPEVSGVLSRSSAFAFLQIVSPLSCGASIILFSYYRPLLSNCLAIVPRLITMSMSRPGGALPGSFILLRPSWPRPGRLTSWLTLIVLWLGILLIYYYRVRVVNHDNPRRDEC